jgi:hypothetical protein
MKKMKLDTETINTETANENKITKEENINMILEKKEKTPEDLEAIKNYIVNFDNGFGQEFFQKHVDG